MTTSSPELRPARKRRRSMKKCESCRKLKVKCTPLERVFEAGERCEQCMARGLPCGPHLPFQKPTPSSSGQAIKPDEARHFTTPRTSNRQLAPSPFTSPNISDTSFTEQGERVSEYADHGFGPSRPGSCRPRPFAQPHSTCSHPRFDEASIRSSVARDHSSLNEDFERLSSELALIHQLRSRRQTLMKVAPAVSLTAFEGHEAKLRIERAHTHACAQFASLLHIQIKTIELTESRNELLLRRLLDHARQYSTLPASQDKRSSQYLRNEQANIPELRGLILQRLITICDEEHRTGEADQFCDELRGLPYTQLLANNLEVRRRIATVSDNRSSRASIAAQHLNIDLSTCLPLVGEHVQKPDRSSSSSATIHGPLPLTSGIHSRAFDTHQRNDCLQRGELHRAIETTNAGLVRHLIRTNAASISERDVLQMSPLLLAASLGDLDIFKILLAAGAQLDESDMFGRSSFLVACETGSNTIIEFLLRAHRDATEPQPLQHYTALFAAAANGHVKSVQCLLAHGAQDAESIFGETASQVAEEKGHLAILALLKYAETVTGLQSLAPTEPSGDDTTASKTIHSNVSLFAVISSNANVADANRAQAITSPFPTTAEMIHVPVISEVTPHSHTRYRRSTNTNSTKNANSLEEPVRRPLGSRPHGGPEHPFQIVQWSPPQSPINASTKPELGSSPQEGNSAFSPGLPFQPSCEMSSQGNGNDDDIMSHPPDFMALLDTPVAFDDFLEAFKANGHNAGYTAYPSMDQSYPEPG